MVICRIMAIIGYAELCAEHASFNDIKKLSNELESHFWVVESAT